LADQPGVVMPLKPGKREKGETSDIGYIDIIELIGRKTIKKIKQNKFYKPVSKNK